MLLNALSNENDINTLQDMILDGTPDKKAFRKTYTKAIAKSLAQGAIVGFALLGVTAVLTAIVASATDGVIEE